MKERKERIKEDLKGIEVLFMVLIINYTGERGKIAENDEVFAHVPYHVPIPLNSLKILF